MTAHSVWANSACSSRSKSSNSPQLDYSYFFTKVATRCGRSLSAVRASRGVGLTSGVWDTFIGAALHSVLNSRSASLQRITAPVFPRPPACRDKLSPVLFHPYVRVLNKSIEFDQLYRVAPRIEKKLEFL